MTSRDIMQRSHDHTSALARAENIPSRAEPQNMTTNFQKALRTMSPGLSIVLDACSMMVLREGRGGGGDREEEREK